MLAQIATRRERVDTFLALTNDAQMVISQMLFEDCLTLAGPVNSHTISVPVPSTSLQTNSWASIFRGQSLSIAMRSEERVSEMTPKAERSVDRLLVPSPMFVPLYPCLPELHSGSSA